MPDTIERAAEKYYFKYVPISPRDEEWGSYVKAIGHAFHPPNTKYPPAIHPEEYHFSWPEKRVLASYQLLYVSRGSGIFESEQSDSQSIHAGNIIILYPGIWHRYTPDWESGWDDSWVCFDGDAIRQLFKKSFFSPRKPVLEVGLHEAIANCFTQIEELMQVEGIGYQKISASWILQLLAYVSAEPEERSITDPLLEQVVKTAKTNLNERVDHPLCIEQLSRDIGVGYSWFRHAFKIYTGMSPKQYHIVLRMDKAKRLLASSSLSVKGISYLLNFSSPSYFTKFFSVRSGMSPSEWRRYSKGHSS